MALMKKHPAYGFPLYFKWKGTKSENMGKGDEMDIST